MAKTEASSPAPKAKRAQAKAGNVLSKDAAAATASSATASARATNLPISTKHSVEISRHLRYRGTAEAKKILGQVIAMEKPLPFRRFNKNTGHKPGMAAGRFPQKAAKHFLNLLASAEANARFKGMDAAALAISHIAANRAPRPMTGGRFPHRPKRTHLEIRVQEIQKREIHKQGIQKQETQK